MNEQISEKSYTEAMQRLQQIASDLESGQISIDALEGIIQESRSLVSLCQQKLRRLETRIEGLDEESC